ncbi:MAG: hypothetical protein DRI90_17820 [Deltaproteobacteria bacterium]|nr:MAG: hypothetical protein DRI90_17820 [Deltaproteobacteria bacterium]
MGSGSGATGGSSASGTGGASSSGTGGASSSGTAGGGGSPGPHSIGGDVTGVIGSGLALQNNGGDDLPVAADGPFTFATELSGGAAYEVTVLDHPSSPEQTCTVQDGQGTVGGSDVTHIVVTCALVDSDGDDIPDLADPFPNDGNIPQTTLPNKVYPHTSSTLFTMEVNGYAINQVGAFWGSGYSGSMTDAAIDQFGVLYGVTFNDLYVCNALTAECWHLAALPQSFNGLTMVPPGTLHPFLDTLVAIANSGVWYRIDLVGPGQATVTSIGQYGSGYTSSGDAFSIDGVGTYAAVNKPGEASDVIISVNPQNGAYISEVGPVPGYTSLYGLAGWAGEVYGFDAGGHVIRIDLNTSTPTVIAQTTNSWWGAAVSTRLTGN